MRVLTITIFTVLIVGTMAYLGNTTFYAAGKGDWTLAVTLAFCLATLAVTWLQWLSWLKE